MCSDHTKELQLKIELIDVLICHPQKNENAKNVVSADTMPKLYPVTQSVRVNEFAF